MEIMVILGEEGRGKYPVQFDKLDSSSSDENIAGFLDEDLEAVK
jgi:hypothetical protein